MWVGVEKFSFENRSDLTQCFKRWRCLSILCEEQILQRIWLANELKYGIILFRTQMTFCMSYIEEYFYILSRVNRLFLRS